MSAPYHPPAVPTTGTLDALPSPLLVRGLSVVLPAHDEVETLAEVVRDALRVGATCAGDHPHVVQALLAAVEELARDPRLACYHYLPATRADLLRRLGRSGEAADAYRQALDLVSNEAERVFLQGRLAQVEGTG